MSHFAEPGPTRNPTMDGEHRVQMGLINALCDAVESAADAGEVGRILERLVDYSRAHFMSEELLMRLDSYEGFGEHVEEHGEMLAALAAMVDNHRAGRSDLLPGQARAMLAFLVRHIQTRDARYANAPRF